jgi:superkiller protein 3
MLSEKGETAEGLEHLEKAVALKPESAAVHNKVASALLKIGQTAEATAHLEKAVELAPDSIEFRFSLAYALAQAGRFSDAIPQLQKSIEISGGRDWQCYDMLGTVYSKMGRADDAIRAGRQALDLALAGHDEELVRTLRDRLASYAQTR